MGTWGAGITGNDTAQDLLEEYKAAFAYYDVDTALLKIDQYVRTMFDESDEAEWCDYFYSLAEFMWKKGILTDEIRDRAISMADNDFGMDSWIEAGKSAEKERRKVIEQFKKKITSPQCAPKKIKLDVHMDDIFEDGEYVAFQLKTADKIYIPQYVLCKKIPDDLFHSFNDKYVVIQKVCSRIFRPSVIVPEVCDRWAVFRMFKGIYNDPEDIVTEDLIEADYGNGSPFFEVESSMFYFKKRGYKIIGKGSVLEYKPLDGYPCLYFGLNTPNCNADSDVVKRVYPFELELKEMEGNIEQLYWIIDSMLGREFGYGHGLPREEYQKFRQMIAKEKSERRNRLDDMLSRGAKVYEIRQDILLGAAVKLPGDKPVLYMGTTEQKYEEMLIKYVEEQE